MFYRFACFAVRVLLRIFTRCKVEGLENVPPAGSLLLVANHVGYVDPPVLGALVPRRIVFMAKEEAFHVFFLGMVVKWYGAFPVRRGQADRRALRTALSELERGGVVGMFPEGTRSKTGKMNEARSGVGLLALQAGALVLPVAIVGTESIRSPLSLLRKPSITVKVGRPFVLERQRAGKDRLGEATTAMMAAVAALLPQERRGFYGEYHA